MENLLGRDIRELRSDDVSRIQELLRKQNLEDKTSEEQTANPVEKKD